jgi:transposase
MKRYEITNSEWERIEELLSPERTGKRTAFLLSAGTDEDSTHAIELLSQLSIENSNILGDKAYGSEKIRTYIVKRGATYTILPKVNTKEPWECDLWLYKERNLVKYFFQKMKWFRRIATRYDKYDSTFLAFVYLAAIMILLK